jgi:hypothetical protein
MFIRTAMALAVAATLGGVQGTWAQASLVDEGSFRLSVRGSTVGTETFTIRQTGSGPGATVVAQGRVTLDSGDQTRALLQVDGPGLRPAAYQVEATGPERVTVRGQVAGNRFRAQVVSATGESMREYLMGEGAVVIDDGVAHHHYFIATVPSGTRIPVIVPRQHRQVTAMVRETGRETIEVAGQRVAARRIAFEPEGMPARTIWVDDRGRVLRVSTPEQGFLAERLALPD